MFSVRFSFLLVMETGTEFLRRSQKFTKKYYLQQVEIGDHAKRCNWDRIFEDFLENSIKYRQKFEVNFRRSPDHPKFKVNFKVSSHPPRYSGHSSSHPPRYSGTFIEPSTSLQWNIHRAIHLVTVGFLSRHCIIICPKGHLA